MTSQTGQPTAPGDLIDRARNAGRPQAGKPSLAMRIRQWRNRQIASVGFRRLMSALPVARWIANRKANDLFRLTSGFIHSQILGACVRLGILDALADGWMGTEALAARAGLPVERMAMLLAQAARLGLVIDCGQGRWMLDDAGVVVTADRGLSAMITHHDMLYRDLTRFDQLLAQPRSDTELRRYWAYVRDAGVDGIASDDVAAYSGLMADSQAMLADCILTAHNFGQYGTLLDVGGGDGAFLTAAARRHPDLRLALFDLPAVAERATDRLGKAGLGNRSDVRGGDFVADRIPDQADCVTLVRILCDHDDGRVRQILANLFSSLKPGTRLIVAEAMAGNTEGAKLAAIYFGIYFLAMGSGRCRSDAEIAGFLSEAGFSNTQTITTQNPLLATLVTAVR